MKLGGRVCEGQWLGKDNESKGACIYWLENKSVTVERNIYHDNTSGRNDEENESTPSKSTQESEGDALSKQTRKPSHKVATLLGGNQALASGVQKPSDDWMAVVEACEDEHAFVTEVQEAEALEPRNLKEAKSHSDWLLWEKAIEDELKSLREARTWEVVNVLKDVNVVGSKWVFKVKKDMSENMV